jgi:single-stranded DNA-specific DHH superfamily exonuclease
MNKYDVEKVAAELARRTRQEQGLPEHITDPAAIATVADLMRSALEVRDES